MRCDCPTTGLTRRLVLKGAGGIALTALLPACSNSTAPPSQGGVPTTPTVPARFLSDAELITLRAFVDRLIPEDTQPGAVIACCAEAIDQLLGAFLTEPAFIYAGAPYSDRGGNPGNDFFTKLRIAQHFRTDYRKTQCIQFGNIALKTQLLNRPPTCQRVCRKTLY